MQLAIAKVLRNQIQHQYNRTLHSGDIVSASMRNPTAVHAHSFNAIIARMGVGLFPVAYLYRADYFGKHPQLAPAGYNRSRDIWIAEEGARRFILTFPNRLPDGTIARTVGGPFWPTTKAPAYLWGTSGRVILLRWQ